MSLQVQFVTIGMMFLSGHGLGFMYDLYRVLSRHFRAPKWVIPLLDVIYWVVATLLVFLALFYSNQGEVRMFVFTGMAAGICFYFLLFSKTVIGIIRFAIKMVKALFQFLRKMFKYLIVAPIKALYRVLIGIFGILMAVAVFLYKIVIQLLYPFWKIFLWLVRPVQKRLAVPKKLVFIFQKIRGWWRRIFRKQ